MINVFQSFKIFFLLVLLYLGGCSREEALPRTKGQLTVLATTVMIADVVAEIGGDRVETTVLIGRELDPHSYEFVKGDDEKLDEADLIFYSGLGLEHGGSVRRYLEHSSKAYGLGDEIAKKNPEEIIRRGGITDPHFWMDVSLWQKIIPLIVQTIGKVDPENRAYYEERGHALYARYEQLHQNICHKMQALNESHRYLVTSHDAFSYFARAYFCRHWESRVLAPEGLAPDGQISLQELRFIIDQIKKHHITVLFPEAYVNTDPLKKIQEGAAHEGLHLRLSERPLYSDSLPPGGTYETMMSHNAGVIYEQLAG